MSRLCRQYWHVFIKSAAVSICHLFGFAIARENDKDPRNDQRKNLPEWGSRLAIQHGKRR